MAVSTKARTRSIAHRWGAACPSAAGPSVVSGATGGELPQWALGIRFDEEDDAAAETFLVKLTAGKTEIVDQLPGAATALAASTAGKVFVLDDRGQVNVGGRRHKLATPRALTWLADGVVLAAADRLWLFSGDGTEVREGPAVKARRIASSAEGVAAALDDGSLLFFDDVATRGAAARGTAISVGGAGHLAALAVDDEGRIAAAAGKSVLYGSRATGSLVTIATAPFEIHAVALHAGRVLLSSRAHGLFNVELQEDMTNPKGLVMPLRPSLRAHTLAVRDGLLVVASDLFVATSDGVDFATRDLAPFVRQAEQRLPKFHSSEDPLSV